MIYTQNPHFLNDGYATLALAVVKDDKGTWVPEHEALFKDIIPRKFYKYHYVQRYYRKGRLHFLWDTLTLKHPQTFRFWIEVTFKFLPETKTVIEKLMTNEDVRLIETPLKYRNF